MCHDNYFMKAPPRAMKSRWQKGTWRRRHSLAHPDICLARAISLRISLWYYFVLLILPQRDLYRWSFIIGMLPPRYQTTTLHHKWILGTHHWSRMRAGPLSRIKTSDYRSGLQATLVYLCHLDHFCEITFSMQRLDSIMNFEVAMSFRVVNLRWRSRWHL